MLKWSTVKAKTKRKPELSEAAAATTLAVSHKNRCVRRALSQVRDWLTVDGGRGVAGSWAEIGRTKLTSAQKRLSAQSQPAHENGAPPRSLCAPAEHGKRPLGSTPHGAH